MKKPKNNGVFLQKKDESKLQPPCLGASTVISKLNKQQFVNLQMMNNDNNVVK